MEITEIGLVRSPIGCTSEHKKTVKAPGFSEVDQVLEKQDTSQVRGMISATGYTVEIAD